MVTFATGKRRAFTVGERKHADTLAPRVARRHRQDR